MTKLLLKLFVKDYQNTSNTKVRVSYGNLSSITGIILNTLLAASKIVLGLLAGLVSLTADGLNNLTDCGSNVVSLIGFKLSAKPADKDHPYGHARLEYIASMIVSFLILFLAIELGRNSIETIISGSEQTFSWAVVAVLTVSVLVKLWMFFFNKKLSKLIDSELLRATATDSISDVSATTAVLISVFVAKWFNVSLDGWLGLVVTVFIAWTGISILKDTVSELMGEAPSEQMIQDIKKRVLSHEGVLSIHDLYVHNYGPNTFYATVHVEVDSRVDVMISHDLTDRIEKDFADNTNIMLVVHMDPVDISDEQTNEWRELAKQYVAEVNPNYSMHDFRVVKGVTHTNWIFDVAIPYDAKQSEAEVRNILEEKVSSTKGDVKYFAVVTVEKQLAE